MHDHSSRLVTAVQPAEANDLLTRVLLGLRLEGVEYGRCAMPAPWAIAFPAQRDARFHFNARGDAWLWTPATGWKPVPAGDAVLLPRGSFHVMASSPDVPASSIDELAKEAVSENVYLVRAERASDAGSSNPAGGVMFCGAMRFNLDPLHPLLAMMPDVIHARDLLKRDPAVLALLDAMEREASMDRIGAYGILARLADVLAASIIRAWVECGYGNSTGWMAAMQCPKVGKVIAAIHDDPARDWDVPTLARQMGASRSRFAETFVRIVGESPARYVAKVKMFQARRWIEAEGMRITVAADRLGYDSEASFSRAFKRIMGVPPSAVRTEAMRLVADSGSIER